MENQESRTDKGAVKIKQSELIKKASMLKAILLSYKNKELSSDIKARVMMNRIFYSKYRKQFDEDVKEAEEAFKPEGFDENLKEASELEHKVQEKTKNEKITEELMKEALTPEEFEKHKSFMEEYTKYMKELIDFKSQKLDEEIEIDEKKFSQKEFENILDVNTDEKYNIDVCLKNDGKNMIVPGSMKSADFMEMLYEEFVE